MLLLRTYNVSKSIVPVRNEGGATMREIRDWLKELRVKRKLTQEEVARLSGISRSHYTHIEQGNKTPSVDVAKAIAKTLKFDWVIFFENNSSQREQQKEVS